MRPTSKEAAYFEVNIHASGEGWISVGLAAEEVAAENNCNIKLLIDKELFQKKIFRLYASIVIFLVIK